MTDYILFPNWYLFAMFLAYFRFYNPYRLYLGATSATAISISFAALFNISVTLIDSFMVFIYSVIISVPFYVSGTIGALIQQGWLLNEQAVQDKRFTDESEALAKMYSIVFLSIAIKDGYLFSPLFSLLYEDIPNYNLSSNWIKVYNLLTNSLTNAFDIAYKYILCLIVISLTLGLVDCFFRQFSISQTLIADIKSIIVISLITLWIFGDLHKFSYIHF